MSFILAFGLMLTLYGCTKTIYVPIENQTKVEYKDSLVFIKDTLLVKLPIETITAVEDSISTLETSLAISKARIEDGKLYHSLTNKQHFNTQIDTTIQVKYINKYIEKQIPVEVIKEVKHIPTLFWWLLGYAILTLLLVIFKLFFTKG